jgi:hypothetical protein
MFKCLLLRNFKYDGIKNKNFAQDLPLIIPGQFGFNCSSGFREEAF